ncbi:hypothetical protein C8Q78DRAFT_668418 [Trametes maxima]|nr:hypothetical protein C8Q78DRAFT_668418 [Trametes maxima]
MRRHGLGKPTLLQVADIARIHDAGRPSSRRDAVALHAYERPDTVVPGLASASAVCAAPESPRSRVVFGGCEEVSRHWRVHAPRHQSASGTGHVRWVWSVDRSRAVAGRNGQSGAADSRRKTAATQRPPSQVDAGEAHHCAARVNGRT